jgi:signal peptidase II
MNWLNSLKSNKFERAFLTPWKCPLLLAAIVAVSDQISKLYVVRHWAYGSQRVVIPGFFNLVHFRNPGAAWGILGGQGLLLGLLSLVAMLGIAIWFRVLVRESKLTAISLALVWGGIAGNLVDRLFRGEVVDFLFFFYGTFQWPAFNLADSAICVGVFSYVLTTWHHQDEPPVS